MGTPVNTGWPGKTRPFASRQVIHRNLLSASDVAAIHRVIDGCCEKWADPTDWQRRLLGGLSSLIGLPIGLSARVSGFAPDQDPVCHWAEEHGWESSAQAATYQQFHVAHHPRIFSHSEMDLGFREMLRPGAVITRTRSEVLSARAWERSVAYRQCYRPSGIGELLFSAAPLSNGSYQLLCFAGKERVNDPRQRAIVELAHREIVPLLGTRLATPDQISLHGLSRRRREVLQWSNRGLPEKLIADRLGLSVATVNEHMQHIYRHFEVHSRAELMAYFIERVPARRAPLSVRRQGLPWSQVADQGDEK